MDLSVFGGDVAAHILSLVSWELVGKVLAGLGGIAGTYALLAWRRAKNRREYNAGLLRGEMLVVANILEKDDTGAWYLKPRTVSASTRLLDAFPNEVTVDKIIAATRKCDTSSPETSFIVLPDAADQNRLMKRIVDRVSEIAANGHVARMCNAPIEKMDCYCCFTFATDGGDRKLRIDVIHGSTLEMFLDDDFVDSLCFRQEEGSHADMARVFAMCAKMHFGGAPDAASYVRRVSMPIPLALERTRNVRHAPFDWDRVLLAR